MRGVGETWYFFLFGHALGSSLKNENLILPSVTVVYQTLYLDL